MFGGRAVGIAILLITLVTVLLAVQYQSGLEQERTQAIAQLVSMPEYENCRYDEQTCPQAKDNVVLPELSGIGIALVGLVLGVYLIINDGTQRKILDELQKKRSQISADERREIVLSVLTKDEQKIILAVEQQPGISQATLRLRTDMSKAKLSQLLSALESRSIIVRIEDGKTNSVQLKRALGVNK